VYYICIVLLTILTLILLIIVQAQVQVNYVPYGRLIILLIVNSTSISIVDNSYILLIASLGKLLLLVYGE